MYTHEETLSTIEYNSPQNAVTQPKPPAKRFVREKMENEAHPTTKRQLLLLLLESSQKQGHIDDRGSDHQPAVYPYYGRMRKK